MAILRKNSQPVWLYLLVTASGLASLSWEVIWQIKISLVLGISAWGTAITLAVMMGGLSLGAFLAGHAFKNKSSFRPFRLYGVLEFIIGISGLLLAAVFRMIESIDTSVYVAAPHLAPLVFIFSIIAAIIIPAMCMGATLPVFGVIAGYYRISIAALYGFNTLGAAIGALVVAFFLMPAFGIIHAGWIIAAVNVAVAVTALVFDRQIKSQPKNEGRQKIKSRLPESAQTGVVSITGFATFALEIIWFRSFTAAFQSTTDAFAIMLAAVLLALSFAAGLAPILKKIKTPLGAIIGLAGILILLITPLMERFDHFVHFNIEPPVLLSFDWFILAFTAIGPPVLLLGIAFPWILEDQRSSHRWGLLYAANTLAAIAGSIGVAWILLPCMGLARSSWFIGCLVIVTSLIVSVPRSRKLWAAIALAALLVAVTQEAGLGRTRIEGHFVYGQRFSLKKILEFYEGPEATVSAVEYDDGGRALLINGFLAAAQFGADAKGTEHYMVWMGHLPMLLHPNPKDALVICFGTGQTANAVRRENPRSLDIVDINPRVFKLAHNFDANQNVLGDPRVKTIVMDGRAYMRRSTRTYDVITLEPMPPNFAGVNALYSQEFYQLARQRLGSKGIIAQWVPFHLVASRYAASIAKTFQSVFPNAILWIDPDSKTGILLGSMNDGVELGARWPGFSRDPVKREYDETKIRQAVFLNPEQVRLWAANGDIISDDNQLLAYGEAVRLSHQSGNELKKGNFDILNKIKNAE